MGGLTSRRTTSKIPLTSNFSPPTKRWLRFSVPTASVPSAWPSFSPLTCHKKCPARNTQHLEPTKKNPAPKGDQRKKKKKKKKTRAKRGTKKKKKKKKKKS